MDADQIQTAFDDVFDQAVEFHGFAEHMRDYDVYVYATRDPRSGVTPEHVRYRFTHCVRADVSTTVPAEVWSDSLDDRLIDYEAYLANELDGYVWGVNWHCLYPGMTLVESSREAGRWAKALGIPFHEARIETNAHLISLVFSTLQVTRVSPGECAFEVTPDGPDFKIPLP
jgi:hypothetical protein